MPDASERRREQSPMPMKQAVNRLKWSIAGTWDRRRLAGSFSLMPSRRQRSQTAASTPAQATTRTHGDPPKAGAITCKGRRRSRGLGLSMLLALVALLTLGAGTRALAQAPVNLLPGWNNIVYLGADAPLQQALAPLGDKLQGVLHWDAAGQNWQVFFAPAPQGSDLTTLQQGEAYWIAVQAPVALAQPEITPQPHQLAHGWNNVAYLGPGGPVSDLVEQSAVWAWDAASQRWLYRNPSAAAISDFETLTPLDAYWLYVAATPSATAPSPTAAPAPSGCYPFQSAQPSLSAVNDVLTRAGLATLPVGADLAPAALRSGPDGSGPLQPPYVPPTIVRAIGWVESGWHQATWSTDRGQTGPTLTSTTCAYGLMQILTDMQVNGTPTPRQAAVGTDFQANAAAAVQLLTGRWNRDPDALPYLGRHDPHILEDWYFSIWSYHCFGTVCEGYGAHNNPDDPALPWPRPDYNSPAQLASQSSFDYSSYPYQELVFGITANPPIVDGQPLWAPIAVQLPPHGSIGYPIPQVVGEPSAHLDDGSSIPVYAPVAPPQAATLPPTGTPAPNATPAPLVPPINPPSTP